MLNVLLENPTHFDEDFAEIEKKTGNITESVWQEVGQQIMFTKVIEERITVHKKIMLEGEEGNLKVDFQVKPPEDRGEEMYVGVIYSGHEVQK
ncbi:hypothetical protein BV454_00522 [Bacillus altitudinis]|uniref:hypothetical protein n=1 Tax=Bacillus altitudinis TaxID=293387 RepID=UPI002018ED56|nr:hypothetical protein [Bacillus altitudinis]MCL4097204.1 hypothetical protein [Bacillus altitudinis]